MRTLYAIKQGPELCVREVRHGSVVLYSDLSSFETRGVTKAYLQAWLRHREVVHPEVLRG